jgi:hypothetical protein
LLPVAAIVVSFGIMIGSVVVLFLSLPVVTSSPGEELSGIVFSAWYEPDGYHLLVYMPDQYGLPVKNVRVVASITTTTSACTGAFSNSSGYAVLVMNVSPPDHTTYSHLDIYENDSTAGCMNGTVIAVGEGSGGYLFAGQVPPLHQGVSALSSNFLFVDFAPNSTRPALLVMVTGPLGSKPVGYSVKYFLEENDSVLPPPDPSKMQTLGTMSDYHATFEIPLFNVSEYPLVAFTVFAPNGSEVATMTASSHLIFSQYYPNP